MIVIKDMKMPKDCMECKFEFFDKSYLCSRCALLPLSYSFIYGIAKGERYKHCPLLEVKDDKHK